MDNTPGTLKDLLYSFDMDGICYRCVTLADLRRQGFAEPAILAVVQGELCRQIDAAAERARGRWITPGVGQSMEYDITERQAEAALKAASTATAAKYPMLAATIGIDFDPSTGAPATDVLGVARGVIAARDVWAEKGAQIREARLRTKAVIQAASSIEAAAAAAAAVIWPAP